MPQKLFFFRKIPGSKKAFSMWDWPNLFSMANLFSSAKSFFTGRIYFVKYMMYVPVPQKLIFQKIPRSKKALFVNVGRV